MTKGINIKFHSMFKILENNQHFVRIMYQIGNQKKYIDLEANKLTKIGLLNCRAKGLPIYENTVESIYQQILDDESNYRVKNEIAIYYKDIGFDMIDNKRVYKHKRLIGLDNKSKYLGEIIKSNQSSSNYINDLFSLIDDNVNLEFIVMASLSSILKTYMNEYLGEKIVNFILHYYGQSSTGKTTALELGISVFSELNQDNLGLLSDWNLTENSLIKKTSTFNGVTLAFDELSAISSNQELSKAIYAISSGADKGRISSAGKQIKSTVGNVIVFSSGEESISRRVNANDGLKVRLIEMESVQWTDSAKQSNDIKKFTSRNYGILAPAFAEAMMNFRDHEILEIYETLKNEYIDEYRNTLNSNFIERVSKQVALILSTTQIFNNVFDMSIDMYRMKEFLHKYISVDARQMNLDKKFYEWFIEFIETNKSYFNDHTNHSKVSKTSTVWGKITIRKNDAEYPKEITIGKNTFQKIIDERSTFTSYEVILDKLKKKNILSHEADRLSRRRVIVEGGSKITTYVIKIHRKFID